jgi:antitoxin VapB
MSTTRVFKSGNSQAVRIPADLAYSDAGVELTIARVGDVITIYASRPGLKDAFAALDALPMPPPLDPIERGALPERLWD